MDKSLKELQKLLNKAMRDIPDKVPKIIEVEGLAFIKKNFRDQGFNTGSRVVKWEARKTVDSNRRDITRYRTNRRGRRGSLNKYGRQIEGRALLVGHKTGGNKLINSFRARRTKHIVRFYTYKSYAEFHNEGAGHLPARPFMKPSRYLNNKIANKLTRTLDNRFNR
ncbi:phage morphogenesis protein [Pseudotamlana carrageenivorans]|uniref:Phage morphogenesis protein n=1 Tax=Pseudotamlana carrageenivorans TaxID=2069432 RepID=A0A2I7SKL6_9FLAO|nr:phage morphogenesis protein [Tamlana carrageenivorans]AUS06469.1 phage morphogenesis protein [Tamlana carrageenivorans]